MELTHRNRIEGGKAFFHVVQTFHPKLNILVIILMKGSVFLTS